MDATAKEFSQMREYLNREQRGDGTTSREKFFFLYGEDRNGEK